MSAILNFMHRSPLVINNSETFRPTSFPPPDQWPVTIDKGGKPLSLYGDDYWDMNAFGFYGYHFGKHGLCEKNKRLLKQTLVFIMYHPKVFPGKLSSCRSYFNTALKISIFCEKHKITICELYRFPHLFTEAAKFLQCSRILDVISHIHKLNLYKDELGFTLGGSGFLKVLSQEAIITEITQHPYIPPRLWNYQVRRLDEFLGDFIKNRDALEKAYLWMCNAYAFNMAVFPKENRQYWSPFGSRNLYKSKRKIYIGCFDDFLEDYELLGLFEKWMVREQKNEAPRYTPLQMSGYLSLVRDVAIIFILNFSMQRKSEAASLRSDCFHVEHDKHLGNICLISGETTKTDPDSDARWVVPDTVKKAIDVAAWIAKLRIKGIPPSIRIQKDIEQNPFLLSPACELWCARQGYEISEAGYRALFSDHRRSLDYDNLYRRGANLFDEKELLITEDDARIALALTPNLHNRDWFGIGKPWRFTTHQARRTLAVDMFASPDVSVGSIQHQMKHFTRNMALYYGRNYSNIHLDSKVQKTLIAESYSSIYRRLVELAENEIENVRPHGNTSHIEKLIDLIDASEEKKLDSLIRSGEVGFRRTLLGFCMKAGPCEYGGIESISKCAGRDGICSDAIFARNNKTKLLKLKADYEREISKLTENDMRFYSLKQEIYAIEVYMNVIAK